MRQTISGLIATSILWTMFAPFALWADAQIIGKARDMKMQDVPSGLKFRLSEGADGAESRATQGAAATDPLTDVDAAKLLGRLPAIKSDPDDQTEFAKRIGTLPAPKVGEKIPVKFPVAEQVGPPESGDAKQPLTVVRFSPEGRVPLAPDLSVTFSHPMVAVTSQEEAAKYAPVELFPQVEGRWRWLGTRTLMFDTDKRFPMATEFTARIPAGTKSANGQALQKDFVWKFTTPPPKGIQMIPSGGQTTRRDAMMFVAFDQAIDPQAVIKTISVLGGGKKLPIRLANPEEIASDGTISYYSKSAQAGRWIAFRAVNVDGTTVNALPGATSITVNIEKGTASAEGPLKTTVGQSLAFNLRADEVRQGHVRLAKQPELLAVRTMDDPVQQFDRQLEVHERNGEDRAGDRRSDIYPSGNYIYIDGLKKGRTTYKVTIDGTLPDTFGQTLIQPATATIKVGSAESTMYAQGGFMSVIDPTAKAAFSIYSTNYSNARVKMYRVRPQDWNAYQEYVRYLNYDDGKRPIMPGQLLSNKVIPIKNIADEVVRQGSTLLPSGRRFWEHCARHRANRSQGSI